MFISDSLLFGTKVHNRSFQNLYDIYGLNFDAILNIAHFMFRKISSTFNFNVHKLQIPLFILKSIT